jgi:hypothetical protein
LATTCWKSPRAANKASNNKKGLLCQRKQAFFIIYAKQTLLDKLTAQLINNNDPHE